MQSISSQIGYNTKVGFGGFLNKKYLNDYLHRNLFKGGEKHAEAKQISARDKKQVRDTIANTIRKCAGELTIPGGVFSIFVFSSIGSRYEKNFGGINGFTPYKNTMHIFLLQRFSKRALVETVAHEFTHAIFFNYHTERQTLLDTMIFEGIADNFREDIFAGKPAAWSRALIPHEARAALRALQTKLYVKSFSLYQEIFFGSKKYKRWTGYSLGYHIVKHFRKKYPALTWEKFIRLKPKEIFKLSGFEKK